MEPLVVANWKMKLGVSASRELATELKRARFNGVEIVVCPSFVNLLAVVDVLKKTGVQIGAQNCFWESSGAYTGEVSPAELYEAGCRYVIIGHSERRQYLRETDSDVHHKVKAALAAGLIPIVCVGETFEQRQQGGQDYVLIDQTVKALEGISLLPPQQLVVAYEPVWVIGSGQAIEPAEAGAAHQVIRQTLIDIFPLSVVADSIRIIYGGSVNESNVKSFTALPHTSGVLVGGASLHPADFIALVNELK